MKFSLGTLTGNWQLKLAALALAILLWVVVSAEQITSQWLPVRVELADRDPTYLVTGGPYPAQVEVRFAGPGRELWELALERPVVVLPLRDIRDESQVFVLDPRMVRVPSGLSVAAQDVRPSSVRVQFQRVLSRDVPVSLRISRRSLERYVLLDTPTVTPARVRVTGPADRVASLTSVPTLPLSLSGADGAFAQRVRLSLDSLPGMRLSTTAVQVRGRADRVVERLFTRVAVAGTAGAVITPAAVEVRAQGPAGRVRALDPAALRVMVRADSLPETLPSTGVSLPVEVSGLPAGIEARAVPARVLVSRPGDVLPPAAAPLPAAAPPPAAAPLLPDSTPPPVDR